MLGPDKMEGSQFGWNCSMTNTSHMCCYLANIHLSSSFHSLHHNMPPYLLNQSIEYTEKSRGSFCYIWQIMQWGESLNAASVAYMGNDCITMTYMYIIYIYLGGCRFAVNEWLLWHRTQTSAYCTGVFVTWRELDRDMLTMISICKLKTHIIIIFILNLPHIKPKEHLNKPAIRSFTYLQIQTCAWYDQNHRLQEHDLIEPVIKTRCLSSWRMYWQR